MSNVDRGNKCRDTSKKNPIVQHSTVDPN